MRKERERMDAHRLGEMINEGALREGEKGREKGGVAVWQWSLTRQKGANDETQTNTSKDRGGKSQSRIVHKSWEETGREMESGAQFFEYVDRTKKSGED